MALKQKIIVEAECETCSRIIEKGIEIEHGSEGKGESTVDLYCPFCGKWVKGKVRGDLYSDVKQARKDQLRMFNLDDDIGS